MTTGKLRSARSTTAVMALGRICKSFTERTIFVLRPIGKTGPRAPWLGLAAGRGGEDRTRPPRRSQPGTRARWHPPATHPDRARGTKTHVARVFRVASPEFLGRAARPLRLEASMKTTSRRQF